VKKFFFTKAPATPTAPGVSIHISNPWHAVSIECGRNGCPAANAVASARFLSKDAPTVPLAGCTKPLSCQCVYKHHDDRRATPRRVADNLGTLRAARHFLGEERRVSRGRRSTDS
jgi:hypothetical protein